MVQMGRTMGLIDADNALVAYIRQLLGTPEDASADDEAKDVPFTEAEISQKKQAAEQEITNDLVTDAQEIDTNEANAEQEVVLKEESSVKQEIEDEPETELLASVDEYIEQPKLRAPLWSPPSGATQWSDSFTGLLLDVHGIAFACPLDLLDHPKPWPENTQEYPEGNEHVKFLAEIAGESVLLLDLASLTMPGRVTGKEQGKIIVPFKDFPVALIVTDVAGAIALNKQKVHWRDAAINDPRAWLAGMIPQERCALLEPNYLLSALVK